MSVGRDIQAVASVILRSDVLDRTEESDSRSRFFTLLRSVQNDVYFFWTPSSGGSPLKVINVQESHPMNHESYQERISLYIDNALNDKDTAELFAHLSGCDECRKFMKITMSVHAHVADEELEEVPASLDRRVLSSVTRESAEIEQSKWYSPVWVTRIVIPLPAAASILFLIIVGSLLFSPLLSQEQPQRVEIPPPLVSKIPASLQNSFGLNK